jgi:hypothetical protein
MKRILGTLAVLAVVAAPSLAAAGLDAPHDFSFATLSCDNCHQMTTRSGSGRADFTLGCITCHNNPGRAFPWSAADQAKPGVGGKHHNWSALASNPDRGATSPASGELDAKLVDGKLQCTVCHDAHRGAAANAPQSRKVSLALGVANLPTGGSGTATMTVLTAGQSPISTRVKVSSAGGFILSHDYGLAASTWFNWSGSAWTPGVDNGPGRAIVANTVYTLDDGVAQVRFSAVPPAGAYWDFTVSFPFVRVPAGADELCLDCHAARVMSSVRVRGEDYLRPNGTTLFSHPVGEALGSNGGGYDRTLILDANGASSQTTGDGVAHNDLVLRANTVMCTTCHAVHGADSNSLTP